MADKIETLSVKDMKTISEAVLNLVFYYPDFPFKATAKNIQWQCLGDSEGIGLFTLQGARYLSRYVSGSYSAQFPFRIVYKCSPNSNKLRLEKQTLVENLSTWLENCSAELKDTQIQIEKIEQTSNVYKLDADKDGYEQYTCSMNLKYFYKK